MYIMLQYPKSPKKQHEFSLRYNTHHPCIQSVIQLGKHTETEMTLNDFIREALASIPQNAWVLLVRPNVFIGKQQDWNKWNQLTIDHPCVVVFTTHEWGGTESTSSIPKEEGRTFGMCSQDAWMWRNGILKPDSTYDIPIHPKNNTAILHAFYHRNRVIPYNVGNKWKVFRYPVLKKTNTRNQIIHNHLAVPFYTHMYEALKKFKQKEYTRYEEALHQLSFSI